MKFYNMKIYHILIAIAVSVSSLSLRSEVKIVNHGKPCGRIIAADSTHLQGAEMLQKFFTRISGAEVPVVVSSTAKAKKGDIVLSRNSNPAVTEDGFALTTKNGTLYITDTQGQGTLYGAITLLEDYLGCSYWSEHDYSLKPSAEIVVPELNRIDNPAFRYRQSQNYALRTDSDYRAWMRLEEPSDEFAATMWVHTFDRLLPSAVYGESHPEYYSYFDGKRHPGKASQWCLSNPEVFEIVCHKLDSIFRANPGKNIISVSQNDGNYTNCQCAECKAIDDHEGALSGSVINFMNKLARRFPDKQISTLAYLYTMHPPKHLRPEKNVNIMLCDIDCYREVPLDQNVSGRDFLKALNGWANISDNIFVWDYGINFDGTSTPFPNFHIMQPNIQTFRDNHVKMHFSQLAGSRGGDMSELRTYLISKLMWNPDLDMKATTKKFLDGYYGAAGKYIGQYLDTMTQTLLESKIGLWIYDSPVTHATGMLSPEMRREYNRLFDQAEEAVKADSALLARVQRSRLSLQYSELDIERTNPNKDVEKLKEMLDTFEARSRRFGLQSVNERNNSPIDYCQLYRERYLPKANTNLAKDATVTFSAEVPKPYDAIAATALTDGLFGGATYKDSWVGWEGQDVTIMVDLKEPKTISGIGVDFLHQLGAWILQPLAVGFSLSTDGENFTEETTYTLADDSDPKVKFVNIAHQLQSPETARYIKVNITGTKQCPHWHYGVGNPCWFFIDEIDVH